MMAGLACREVSPAALKVLEWLASDYVAIPDSWSSHAMTTLADGANDVPIVSGESAAAGLGVLLKAAEDPNLRSKLGLKKRATSCSSAAKERPTRNLRRDRRPQRRRSLRAAAQDHEIHVAPVGQVWPSRRLGQCSGMSPGEIDATGQGADHRHAVPSSSCRRDPEARADVEPDGGVKKMHVQRQGGKLAAFSLHNLVEQRPADPFRADSTTAIANS